jgi:tetratricopeptide (TPR) repeat protein
VLDANDNKVFDPNQNGKLNAVKFVGHFVNLVVFGFTCVILFWLLGIMLSGGSSLKQPRGYAFFVAFGAALLFTMHPIHSEAVANIKGRDEIVALLGSLLAMYLSFKAFHEKRNMLMVFAGVVFFLGLLSKENAITFLAVVPLSFFYFTKANLKQILLLSSPYILAASLFLIIRGSILGWGISGDPPRELMNNPFLKLVGNQYVDFTAGEKYGTIFYTLLKYLQLHIFPHPLTHDYYPRAIDIMKLNDWKVILSILLHLAMGIFTLIRLPKKDPISYGILFYLATLSIVSNIVFPVGTHMNERFAFMPSVGLCLVAAVFFYRITGSWAHPSTRTLAIAGIILALMGAKTFIRNFAWKDNYTLFSADLKASSNSAKIRNALGGETARLATKPENAERKDAMLNEALGHLDVALRIHPGYANAALLKGNSYFYLNQFDSAVYYYRFALTTEKDFPDAINNLFLAFRDGGRFFGEKMGDLTRAAQYLNEAYLMRPNDFETLRLLGVLNGVQGNTATAIDFFRKALEQNPNDAGTYFNLSNAFHQAGDPLQAELNLQKAKEINPNIEQEMLGSGR